MVKLFFFEIFVNNILYCIKVFKEVKRIIIDFILFIQFFHVEIFKKRNIIDFFCVHI